MVALRMEDLKGFTAGLFMGELFDSWLVREAEMWRDPSPGWSCPGLAVKPSTSFSVLPCRTHLLL